MKQNPGHLPPDAAGRRVRVRLSGDQPGVAAHEWPADGAYGCSWLKRGLPVDIAEYEVIG